MAPKRRVTLLARITRDAKKLWSCKEMPNHHWHEHIGSLPKCAGEKIVLHLPSKASPYCDAPRAWKCVAPPWMKKLNPKIRGVQYWVCEHMVDIDAP